MGIEFNAHNHQAEDNQPASANRLAPAKKRLSIINKIGKKRFGFGLIALIALVAIGLTAFVVISDLTMPVKISKAEITMAMSSRTENPEVRSSFKQREPIMLHFEYHSAKVGSGIKFEVKDQEGNTIKSGTTTVLRPTGDDPSDGQRYVSIVNAPSTALKVGKYTIDLSFEERHIHRLQFEVVE